jgi:large subunit ribosomal protein L2
MKKHKPITPAQRGMIAQDYSVLTKKKPEKGLTLPLRKKGGRGASGRITIRRKGGGEKRQYRKVDFGQEKIGIKAQVLTLEYDPSRSAFIILLLYKDGEKHYRLAPEGIKIGDEIICEENAPQKIGNRLKIKNILPGSMVFNIELSPGKRGSIARTAGSAVQILSREKEYVTVRMPSKETRMIPGECFATLGQVSNPEHKTEVLGKAGKTRHRGIRSKVRGKAMNPCDHPHGGGEGRTKIGLKHPKTPWGKPAHGKKTRKKGKWSDRFIIKRRK